MKSGGIDAEVRRETPGAARSVALQPTAAGFQFDDLQIDVRTRRVLRNGTDLAVTSLSFDLLLALVRAAPGIVTFNELMEQVWAGVVVSPETLTQRVKLLRQALGDSAEQPRYILAVRGHGYRLRMAAVPLPASPAAQPAPVSPGASPARWWRGVAPVLIVLGGVAVGWLALAPADDPPQMSDGDAWHYYQQAESIVNGTPEGFQAAISLYDQALARDPQFAAALSGRALNRAAQEWTGSSLGRGLEGAQSDASRALELDPEDGRAHVVLASLSAMRAQWPASEASFRAALNAGTRRAEHRARYAATLLLPTGQVRKAVLEARAAQVAEPGSTFIAAMLAFIEHARGADAEAVRLADLAVSRGGDSRQLAPVYASAAMRRGHHAEAAGHVISVLPPGVIDAGGAVILQQAYAALGDPTRQTAALAALRSLTSGPAWERVAPRTRQAVLYLYAAFGATDDVHDEMNRLLGQGPGAYPQIIAISAMWSPEMRALRQDRRFQALVERLGLVEYWKRAGPPDGCALTGSKLTCEPAGA